MADLSASDLQTLLANPWFAGLPDTVRADIARLGRCVTVGEGECVFHRGDAADGWYVLIEGSLRISGSSQEGRPALLTFFGPGQWVGDISLVDGGPRSHDAVAHAPCRLLRLSPSDFHALLELHPSLSLSLLRRRCAAMRQLMDALESSTVGTLEERLADRLLALSERFGVRTEQGVRIELHLSQEHLAQIVGVSRPRVTQIMRQWQSHEWVHQVYGRILLRNVAALERLRSAIQAQITGAAQTIRWREIDLPR